MQTYAEYNFKEKIAIVTGASRGIGKQICRDLLDSGCRVLGTFSKNEVAAEDCRQDFKLFGTNFILRKSDVSVKSEAAENFSHAKKLWGNHACFLVNNAGILSQENFLNLSVEAWDNTMKINVRGAFLLSQSFIQQCNSSGSIVNISSVGGQTGGPKAPDYAASKSALISLTKSVANIGVEHAIRSNTVSPGWIETDIFKPERLSELKEEAKHSIPMKRMGKPSEISRAVLFLLSDEASYITGQCLNVNGGLYLG